MSKIIVHLTSFKYSLGRRTFKLFYDGGLAGFRGLACLRHERVKELYAELVTKRCLFC